MNTCKLTFRSLINFSTLKVMSWHLRPNMEQRSLPPWENFKLKNSSEGSLQEGRKLYIYRKVMGILPQEIVLEYRNIILNQGFELHQVKGPFCKWVYKMKLQRQGEHTCEIIDQIHFMYRKPKFLIFLMYRHLEKRVKKIFKYKHEILQSDLMLLEKYPYHQPLKILVSGATGFVGSFLCSFLEFAGHDVWILSRSKKINKRKVIIWDPLVPEIREKDFEGFDAVINLAGENISTGWWTEKKKNSILNSRYKGTENLVKVLASLKCLPKTFISASAVGFYGDRQHEILTEDSSSGKRLFLSKVCQYWERAAFDLEERGVRVVCTRFGMILSIKGGALKKMLLPFQLGIGGRIGNGRQYISWIAIDDLIGSLYHVLMTPRILGPVNCTAPNPVNNACFAKELAKVINRWPGPAFPAFMIYLLLGQKGEELLLSSSWVEPRKLLKSGYTFQYPILRQALEHVL